MTNDLNDMIKNPIPTEEDPQIRAPIASPIDAIRQATGMTNLPDNMLDMNKEVPTATNVETVVLTPDEMAQFTINEKVDFDAEADARYKEKIRTTQEQPVNDLASLMEDALEEENERLERHEALTDKTEDEVSYTPRDKDTGIPSDDSLDMSDLVPSYDYEEDLEEPEAVDKKPEDKRPEAGDEDAYAKYVQDLPLLDQTDPPEISMISVQKERLTALPVVSGRVKDAKVLGDQAFLNSINKFKKDNFRTVTIPLINSGFCVDIVGTGEVDLSLLYSKLDNNITENEYATERMMTVMRNVVGTSPKVDKNDLRNMIHFADYQLMAYAHISATLKDVNMIHTCSECGQDFRIVHNSSDMILNIADMKEKMEIVRSATKVQPNSLLTTDKELNLPSGFLVKMGHPSYAEYIQYLTALKGLQEDLPKSQLARLATMAVMLPYIRSIILPNGIHTNNLMQKFNVVCLFSTEEYTYIQTEIGKMAESIIYPQFGIKKATCPHCKTVNKDIAYENLEDLLFFHTTVTRLLNQTENQ